MMFYQEIIEAKNSQKIPVFNSGKAAHSKYNPKREAENFARESDGACFAIILGVAGGCHIKAFMARNPECKIIAVEKSREDFTFLQNNIPCVKEIAGNKNFCAAFPETVTQELLKNYLPALYGDLAILTLRTWAEEDSDFYKSITQTIKGALKQIGADFSVQSHFGALWQKNIFANLKTLSKMQNFSYPLPKIDTSKTAAVIAAGPSFDKTIDIIKRARQNYFVIATDTSFKALMRQDIVPDAAVSIDAQALSANHFIGKKCRETLFVLSLDAAPSIARALYQNGNKVIFTSSGHPIISFASQFCSAPFMRLQSGSGTVTIAAADFAKNCGFERLEIFGADFAYSRGKPYTKGTYLDDLYRKDDGRLKNAEGVFAALMFRTPLERSFVDGVEIAKTEVLDSYKKTLTEWLSQNCAVFEYKNFIWSASAASTSNCLAKPNGIFNAAAFKKAVQEGAQNALNSGKIEHGSPFTTMALPYMAFLQKKNSKTFSPLDNFMLALKQILVYNKNL